MVSRKCVYWTYEVAGYYYNLHLGFIKIGVNSDYVVYHYHKNNYTKHQDGGLIVRIICYLNKYSVKKNNTTRFVNLIIALL